MINYIWKSTLADHIQEYLVLKRMAGFKCKRQGRLMEVFDQYCYDTGFKGDRLNIELVAGFCYEYPTKRPLLATKRKNY